MFNGYNVTQHAEPSYMPEVPSFAPMWGQEAPPQIVAYPELMAGFPCGELAMWPRSQMPSAATNHHPTATATTRSSRSSSSNAAKKARRRVASIAQRRAANIRERRRMFNLNEAFDKLRRKVPTFAYEKRLSRIETLRLAITYIGFMSEILATGQPSHQQHHHHQQQQQQQQPQHGGADIPRSTDLFSPVAHHAASVATAVANNHTTYNHSV